VLSMKVSIVRLGARALMLGWDSPRAEPLTDPFGIWTLQDESASMAAASLTDRSHVNGLSLG
jgi:hypothetical protein